MSNNEHKDIKFYCCIYERLYLNDAIINDLYLFNFGIIYTILS